MSFPTANIIPIYTTSGEPAAYLGYPYLFGRNGEWVGWVTASRDVYSVLGHYVGYLTNDPRILRRRSDSHRPRLDPPPAPRRISIPAQVPLARMMSEIPQEIVDVLMEEPERLHTSDLGELRNDMD
jgi:4-fold beta-flower domain-containing protein